jgi:hypothetical protein
LGNGVPARLSFFAAEAPSAAAATASIGPGTRGGRSRRRAGASARVVGGRDEIGLAARGQDHLLAVLRRIAPMFAPTQDLLLRNVRL